MWKKSAKKLVVRIERSRTLFFLLLSIHLGAWGGLLMVPVPEYAKAALIVIVGISLWRSLVTHASRHALTEIELQEHECAVRSGGGKDWIAGKVVGAFVHPWLVILRLRLDDRRWPVSIVMLRGATDPGAFRELRVRLSGLRPGDGATTGGV